MLLVFTIDGITYQILVSKYLCIWSIDMSCTKVQIILFLA
jgi:hypothetical protein